MRLHRTLQILALLTGLFFTVNAQDSIVIEPKSVEVEVGKTKTITITGAAITEQTIPQAVPVSQYTVELVKVEVGRITLSVKGEAYTGSPIPLVLQIPGEPTQVITVDVKPDLTMEKVLLSVPPGLTNILQGKVEKIGVTHRDGISIENNSLTTEVSPPLAAEVRYANGEIFIRAMKPGAVDIALIAKNGNRTLHTVSFNIVEAAKSVAVTETIVLNQSESKEISALVSINGEAGNPLTLKKSDFTITNLGIAKLSDDGKSLIAGTAAGKTDLLIERDNAFKRVTIEVRPVAKDLIINSRDGSLEMSFPAKSVTLEAKVQDLGGSTAQASQFPVRWEITESPKAGVVLLSPNPRDNSVTLSVKEKLSQPDKVKVKGCVISKPEICAEMVVFIPEEISVVDFRPLKIRLDLMDKQTARDLFGKVSERTYFIAKVRLFNMIKDRTSEFFGDSILVYSESMEVKVALEIKEDGSDWRAFKPEDLEGRFPEIYGDLQRRESTRLLDGQANQGRGSYDPDDRCHVQRQEGFWIPYRPLTFEMVANTHDRRGERSLRSKTLFWLNLAGSASSIFTSVFVPAPKSDVPVALDKFNNLLIPGYEKLFPSLREVQRQNIVSMVMRPLEEVAFGSDITRILFFPKKPIKGVFPSIVVERLDGNGNAIERTFPAADIRISGVSISDACADVAIIKKRAQ
ncbi:MAG: hypothetical protein OEM82_13170 [Acidobacteriota bacterium]|nr:hypothetical protein [Acidobacteriota bacterium]MDH3530276.1 hypothetical protein [Acidobacteriota bacterium]